MKDSTPTADFLVAADARASDAKTARRAAYVQGLRDLAAFLDAHPDLPISVSPASHIALVDTKDEIVVIAREPGVRWEKNWGSDTYFGLARRFAGGHCYQVFVERGRICRKEIIGTTFVPPQPARQVEQFRWVCEDESLLADPAVVGEPELEAQIRRGQA